MLGDVRGGDFDAFANAMAGRASPLKSSSRMRQRVLSEMAVTRLSNGIYDAVADAGFMVWE